MVILKNIEVDSRWLMSQREFDRWADSRDFSEAWNAIYPYVVTFTWGGMVIHEKIHGMQDYDLPLPILEAAAYWYQSKFFEVNNWQHGGFNIGIKHLTNLYSSAVDEFGDDLHMLIFGNNPNKNKADEILSGLKEIFTEEELGRYPDFVSMGYQKVDDLAVE